MNGIDINRFQFEYDLTWMSFFQNHDGRTYLRYGGREDDGPDTHLSKDSLLIAMNKALELHASQAVKPTSQYEPINDEPMTPEDIPSIQKMLAKRKVKCIHCHDVKTAKLTEIRSRGKLKKEMVFSYPSPTNLGIQLDPINQNKIKSVDNGSAAMQSGLKAGDILVSLAGQDVFTYGDATRVLELAPQSGQLDATFVRAGKRIKTEIMLGDKWRTGGDPSWRESTHVFGPNSGFWAVLLTPEQKSSFRLAENQLALKITAIWGAWARKAGLKHGDVVVSIDGKSTAMHIRQLQTYLQMKKNWGDSVEITVLRGAEELQMNLDLPTAPTNE